MEARNVTTICPYCGHKNKIYVKSLQPDVEVIWCDSEEGGCDQEYAVKAIITIKAEISKIDWKEKNNGN